MAAGHVSKNAPYAWCVILSGRSLFPRSSVFDLHFTWLFHTPVVKHRMSIAPFWLMFVEKWCWAGGVPTMLPASIYWQKISHHDQLFNNKNPLFKHNMGLETNMLVFPSKHSAIPITPLVWLCTKWQNWTRTRFDHKLLCWQMRYDAGSGYWQHLTAALWLPKPMESCRSPTVESSCLPVYFQHKGSLID